MAIIITKILSMIRISILSALAVQIIFFMSSGCVKKEEATKKKREFSLPVQIGKIVFKDVTDQVRTVGNIQAEQRVIINSEVAGQITDIVVREGDMVEVGDLLARIDSREYELEVEELEAELSAAKEEFKKAIKKFELASLELINQSNTNDKDKTINAFRNLAGTCKGCHQKFRN